MNHSIGVYIPDYPDAYVNTRVLKRWGGVGLPMSLSDAVMKCVAP